jgi:hypothetical protein
VNRRVVYLAAPFTGDPGGNLERARRWVAWLMEREPDVAVQCSWMALGEVPRDQVERVLLDCEALAATCEWIVLVGGRVTAGMERELQACIEGGGYVADLTSLGPDPLGVAAAQEAAVARLGALEWGAGQWEAP